MPIRAVRARPPHVEEAMESLLVAELNLVMAEFELFTAELAVSTRMHADAGALNDYLSEGNMALQLAATIRELTEQARASRARRFPTVVVAESVDSIEASAAQWRSVVAERLVALG